MVCFMWPNVMVDVVPKAWFSIESYTPGRGTSMACLF